MVSSLGDLTNNSQQAHRVSCKLTESSQQAHSVSYLGSSPRGYGVSFNVCLLAVRSNSSLGGQVFLRLTEYYGNHA